MKRLLKSCLVGCLILAITNQSFAEKAARTDTDLTAASQPVVSLLRLKMSKDSTNTDEIVIRCDNKASSKMVYGEDASDMGGINPEVSLSAYSSDNVRLAIDFLPFPGLQADTIALFVGAKSSGTYHLASTQLYALAPGYDVWLKDSFTGDSLKLALNSNYTFSIDKNNPATFGKKRFVVVICQNPESAYSLANFTASQASVGHLVQIGWKMNNEHPNTNYTVERSIDTGKTFVSLASLPGTGAGEYDLSDNNPVAGQNYYHLKVVDSSNTVSYSQLVKIENKSSTGTDSTVASQAVATFLRLKMRKDSTNTDEIVIRCDNKASSKMVYGEDAFDLGGIGPEVSLSAYSSDNVPLAIDVLPFPGLRADTIALSVGAKSSGNYQLASTLSGLAPGYEVWLKDSFTGDSLKLALNSTYTFNIDKNNPATFGKKRLVVVIRQNPETAYSLASFTASQASVGRPVQLGWTMNNEHPNTNYTVERSIDTGKTFVSLASLPGTGAGDYYLSDNNPVAGQNYYHLKVVDSTNTVSYSQLVEIENKSGTGAIVSNPIKIYPNPVSNLVNVSITEKKPVLAGYDITITNSSGMVVKKSSAGQADWQSGVDTLKPGIYLIQVTDNNDHSFVGKSKFVKL